MMSKMMAFAWSFVGLLCYLMTAQSKLTTTTLRTTDGAKAESTAIPCVGQQVLDKLNAMDRELKALQQKTSMSPSQYSVVGFQSFKDLMEVKNKLFVLETKLETAENRMGASESKLTVAESRLTASESKLGASESKLTVAESKLTAAETKLEATETKLQATEIKLEAAETKIKNLEPMVSKLATTEMALKVFESKLETTAETLQATQTESRKKGASTFVQWGRKSCSNTSQLVYSGVVGGSHYTHSGGAADALCLTMVPEFDSTPVPPHLSHLFGAEYEYFLNHLNQDIPCSVCRTPHSTTLMIPTTHTCPRGWMIQYTGYLAAGHPTHKAPTQYICLDRESERVDHGHLDHNGYLLYPTTYVCGSLPCPPYTNNKLVLCVVCSK